MCCLAVQVYQFLTIVRRRTTRDRPSNAIEPVRRREGVVGYGVPAMSNVSWPRSGSANDLLWNGERTLCTAGCRRVGRRGAPAPPSDRSAGSVDHRVAAAAGRCVDIGRVSRRGLAVRVALRLVVDRPAVTREEKAPASFGPGPSCLSHPSSRERRVRNSTSLRRLDHPRHGRRCQRMPLERVGGKLPGRYNGRAGARAGRESPTPRWPRLVRWWTALDAGEA